LKLSMRGDGSVQRENIPGCAFRGVPAEKKTRGEYSDMCPKRKFH